MKSRALLRRLARGDVANVRFSDLRRLLGDLGFEQVRVSGSHEIYAHPSVTELVNLQEVKGHEAVPAAPATQADRTVRSPAGGDR